MGDERQVLRGPVIGTGRSDDAGRGGLGCMCDDFCVCRTGGPRRASVGRIGAELPYGAELVALRR